MKKSSSRHLIYDIEREAFYDTEGAEWQPKSAASVRSSEMRLRTPEEIEAKLMLQSRYLHEPLTKNERRLIKDVLLLMRTTEPVSLTRCAKAIEAGYVQNRFGATEYAKAVLDAAGVKYE